MTTIQRQSLSRPQHPLWSSYFVCIRIFTRTAESERRRPRGHRPAPSGLVLRFLAILEHAHHCCATDAHVVITFRLSVSRHGMSLARWLLAGGMAWPWPSVPSLCTKLCFPGRQSPDSIAPLSFSCLILFSNLSSPVSCAVPTFCCALLSSACSRVSIRSLEAD